MLLKSAAYGIKTFEEEIWGGEEKITSIFIDCAVEEKYEKFLKSILCEFGCCPLGFLRHRISSS